MRLYEVKKLNQLQIIRDQMDEYLKWEKERILIGFVYVENIREEITLLKRKSKTSTLMCKTVSETNRY